MQVTRFLVVIDPYLDPIKTNRVLQDAHDERCRPLLDRRNHIAKQIAKVVDMPVEELGSIMTGYWGHHFARTEMQYWHAAVIYGRVKPLLAISPARRPHVDIVNNRITWWSTTPTGTHGPRPRPLREALAFIRTGTVPELRRPTDPRNVQVSEHLLPAGVVF